MSESYLELADHAREVDDRRGGEDARGTLAAMLPARVSRDFQKLRKVVTRHRVIILNRGAVIAITTLVAVGTALLIHAMIAGVVIWGILFPIRPLRGDGKTFRGEPDNGGSPSAFAVSMSTSEGAPAAGLPDQAPTAQPFTEALAALPTLPELPFRNLPEPLETIPLPMPNLPQPDDRGSIKVTLPSAVAARVAAANDATPREATLPTGRGNPNSTNVAYGGFDDEPVFGLGRGDGNGNGRGRGIGNGAGNGVDRGPSAASRSAAILNSAEASRDLAVPLKYQLKPPEKPVLMRIDVRADGTIGNVTVTGSCGVEELDELVREYSRLYLRFSPAYQNGKAVPSTFEYGHSFRPFD